MTRTPWLVASGLLAGLSACGGGNLAEKVAQPKAMTANEALDGKASGPGACLQVGARDTPLVVDLKAMDRADLEQVMHRGVGVVAYDCKKLKLLDDCRLTGDYEFIATSKKSEAVQFASADEVQANLPFSASLLVKAGYGRQSSLDLATVMIGKRTATTRTAAVADAKGSCEGATHFIRGAYVGAFAMKTGVIGKVEAAATIFGYSGSGKSDSSKKVENRDGNPEKCEQVALDAKAPPAECSALLRLELVALATQTTASTPAKPSDPAPEELATCPSGTSRGAGGVCIKDSSKPHACAATDLADCTAQCEKGNSESCATLGVERLKANQDVANATKLLERSCAAGVGLGCNGLGVVAAKGIGRTADFAEALKSYSRACDLGYVRACYNVASAHAEGQGVPADKAKAEPIYARACAGGMGLACMNLGVLLTDKAGAARDMARAVTLFERACWGGEGQACANAAIAFNKGDGVKQDAAKAKELAQRACQSGHAPSCGGR
jgi:TPR repeat protein